MKIARLEDRHQLEEFSISQVSDGKFLTGVVFDQTVFILVQNWLITHLWVYLEELREAPLNSCISCTAQSGSLLAACSKALRKAYRYLFWRMLALSCLHMCLYFSWRYEQSLSSRDLREEPPSSSNLLRKRFIAFIMRYTFLWVTFKYF